MHNKERLEVIEVASRLMREEIKAKNYQRDEKLKIAAQSAISDYSLGGSVADLWSDEGDSNYLEDYLKI